jgi:ribosome recycling factor
VLPKEIPLDSTIVLKPWTKNSLTTITKTIQLPINGFNENQPVKNINEPQMRTLSTKGSAIRPNLVIIL